MPKSCWLVQSVIGVVENNTVVAYCEQAAGTSPGENVGNAV